MRTSRLTQRTNRALSLRQKRSWALGFGRTMLAGTLLRRRGVPCRRGWLPLARLLGLLLMPRMPPILGAHRELHKNGRGRWIARQESAENRAGCLGARARVERDRHTASARASCPAHTVPARVYSYISICHTHAPHKHHLNIISSAVRIQQTCKHVSAAPRPRPAGSRQRERRAANPTGS